MRAGLAALLALALAHPVRADFVSGCALQDGKVPRIVLRMFDDEMQLLGSFDSFVDAKWQLPNSIQTSIADATMQVEYVAEDLREMYGNLHQSLSVQFADLLPPDKMSKHPAGRADDIPIGEMRPVVEWIGTATFFTVSGIVTDYLLNTPCQWFCQFDLNYAPLATEARSFGAVKALY